MKMTAAQMAAFDRASEEEFIERLLEVVSEEVSPERLDSDVRQLIRALSDRARRLNFITEMEVAAFVLCGAQFGMDFDTRADLPFARILAQPGETRRAKAERFLERFRSIRAAGLSE
jgi:hypothetical protein